METTGISKPRLFFLYDIERDRFLELSPYLGAGFVLGRETGNETFPDDASMSRAHAMLSLDESGAGGVAVQIEDLGSTNGIRINDSTIRKGEKRRLNLHDLVGVGSQLFILTNQRQYRPVIPRNIIDLTLVGSSAKPVSSPAAPAPPAQPAPPALPPEDDDRTTIGRPKNLRRPEKPPRRKEDRQTFLRGLPLERRTVFILLALALAAGTLWLGRGRIRSRPAPQAVNFPGAPKPNAILRPDGRESYWEAFPLQESADALYLKNVAILTRKAPFVAMNEKLEILQGFLGVVRHDALPLGEDHELETLADTACRHLGGRPGTFPSVPLQSVLGDVATGRPETIPLLQSEAFGPLEATLLGARLSTVRFPPRDGKPEIASIVILCSDLAGQRLARAQRRATLFHLKHAREALNARLLRHEKQMVAGLSDSGSRESIKAARMNLQYRAIRNLLEQNRSYLQWLETPEGGAVARLKALAADFSAQLQEDLSGIERSYAKARFVNPIFYPVLKKDAPLEESDLLFLAAY